MIGTLTVFKLYAPSVSQLIDHGGTCTHSLALHGSGHVQLDA